MAKGNKGNTTKNRGKGPLPSAVVHDARLEIKLSSEDLALWKAAAIKEDNSPLVSTWVRRRVTEIARRVLKPKG